MNSFYVKATFFVLFSTVFLMLTSTSFSGEYEDYLRGEKESFQSYKDARDGEFIGFLKEQWSEFQINQGLTRDTKPKPVAVPVAKIDEEIIEEPLKSKPLKDIKIPVLDTAEPVVIEPEPAEKVFLVVNFYKRQLNFYSDFMFPEIVISGINKNEITKFWDLMSKTDYELFIQQARSYQKKLKLNDWGYHNLLNAYAAKRFSQNQNINSLFVWFMSSKSGYDARVGYNMNKIYLLLPSRNNLFGLPFLTIKQKKYYSLSFDNKPEKFKSLFTYKGDYPEADRLMDYRLLEQPELITDIKTRKLEFSYLGKTYSVDTQYNKGLIDYFEYYPQTNIKVYFDAAILPETGYSLISALKPILADKSEAEAVNIILKFVQTSLKYKTDADQFGREKYLLPHEAIYYPYCDCEDRSFLFSYLVKQLTGLEVIGLDYPGHISTAVRFSDNLKGDYIVLNNKKYMVCDPTYINARLGMAMPKFKNSKPKIVKLQ